MSRALKVTELPIANQFNDSDTLVGVVNGRVSNIPKPIITAGSSGTSGINGVAGSDGATGATGAVGPTGPAGSAGGGASTITDILYSDLVTGINGGSLVKGAYYRITDFKTCYDRPEYDVNGSIKASNQIYYGQGNIEPIIVLATDINKIGSTAYQVEYPKDRIQYDWTFNSTEITESPAFGRISERIDEYNNRTDYDHRNISYIRFRSYAKGSKLNGKLYAYNSSTGVVTGTGTSFLTDVHANDVLLFDTNLTVGIKVVSISSDTQLTAVVDSYFADSINFTGGTIDLYSSTQTDNYDDYKEVYIGQKIQNDFSTFKTFNLDGNTLNNYIGDYSKFYINANSLGNSGFLLANNVFFSSDSKIYSNKIGDRSYNNTARFWFLRNTIEGRFYNNTVGHYGFYGNNIGEYFNNNIIQNSFYENSTGVYFDGNKINSSFYGNKVENYFENNIIFSGFYDNTIGNYFYGNIIFSNFYQNIIETNFSNNIIEKLENIGSYEFRGNIIQNNFQNNTIYNYFYYNNIGNQFKGNFAHYEFSINTVFNYVAANQFEGGVYSNRIGSYTASNDFLGDISNNNWSDGFISNTICNNFTYNYIRNQFTGNHIGHNFQYNTINKYLQNMDLTVNCGNIVAFTYTNSGTTSTNGSYTNISGTALGNGVNAYFDITISGGIANSVTSHNTYSNGKLFLVGDSIKIHGDSIGGKSGSILTFSNNSSGKRGSNGTYTSIIASGIGNTQGENSKFDVTVINGVVTAIQLNDGGGGYSVGERVLLVGSSFGGINGTDDITITVTDLYSDDLILTVTSVSNPPPIYQNYNKEIFNNKVGINRLSYYDDDTLIIDPLLPTSFTLDSSDFTNYNHGNGNTPNGNTGFAILNSIGTGEAFYSPQLSLNNGGNSIKLNELISLWSINNLNVSNNSYMFKANWGPGSNPGSNVALIQFNYDGDNNSSINIGIVDTSNNTWKTSNTGYYNGISSVPGIYNFPATFTLIEPIITDGNDWC